MTYLCNYDVNIATPLPKLLSFYPKLTIVLPPEVTYPFIFLWQPFYFEDFLVQALR